MDLSVTRRNRLQAEIARGPPQLRDHIGIAGAQGRARRGGEANGPCEIGSRQEERRGGAGRRPGLAPFDCTQQLSLRIPRPGRRRRDRAPGEAAGNARGRTGGTRGVVGPDYGGRVAGRWSVQERPSVCTPPGGKAVSSGNAAGDFEGARRRESGGPVEYFEGRCRL